MARASQTAGTPLLGTVVQVWTNVRTAATVWVCPKKPGHTHKPPIAKDWPVFLKGRPSSQKRSDGLAREADKGIIDIARPPPLISAWTFSAGLRELQKAAVPATWDRRTGRMKFGHAVCGSDNRLAYRLVGDPIISPRNIGRGKEPA